MWSPHKTAPLPPPRELEAVLFDADGCLFPSEVPAFAASVHTTNEFMEYLGSTRRFSADELRATTTGRNFRMTATSLAEPEAVSLTSEEFEAWVAREASEVAHHLADALVPDPAVISGLELPQSRYRLALVSSSAVHRITTCLNATGLEQFFPPPAVFSAEDTLDEPKSKPDPSIYLHALRALGFNGERCLAIEDSVPGLEAAVAAGIPALGNLAFVEPEERDERRVALEQAGAVAIVESWDHLPHAVQTVHKNPQPSTTDRMR